MKKNTINAFKKAFIEYLQERASKSQADEIGVSVNYGNATPGLQPVLNASNVTISGFLSLSLLSNGQVLYSIGKYGKAQEVPSLTHLDFKS